MVVDTLENLEKYASLNLMIFKPWKSVRLN